MPSDQSAIASGAPINSSGIELEEEHQSDFHADFKGPLPGEHRKCTDAMWSVLFCLFWGGMLYVGSTAFSKASSIGGSNRHISGYQMDGKICGQDGEFGAGVEYKYRMQVLTGLSTSTIPDSSKIGINGLCVKNCPKKTMEAMAGRVENKLTQKTEAVTMYAMYPTDGNPTYTTYCLPAVNATKAAAQSAAASASSFISSNITETSSAFFQEMLYDVNDAMGAIWASFAFSILFSFLFLFFIKMFAGVAIFIAITLGLSALAVVGYFFYFLQSCTIADQATYAACGTLGEYQIMTYQLGCGLAWGLFVILFLVVVFMRDRILLAIKLMTQAVNAINDMKLMLLTPILMLLPLIAVLLWWLYVCVAMAAAGDLNVTGNTTVTSGSLLAGDLITIDVPLRTVVWDDTMHYLFYYHIFGLLWTAAFFMAALNFILSSATSQWYFAETVNGEKDLNFPVVTGVKRAFGIHGGTMVFGSFLVAVFESIRMIVDYLAHKARKESGNNVMVRMLCCIAQCCVRCFECIVKWITSEAYVFTALFGTNLCGSVKKTFAFIGANIGRIGILTMVGNMIVLIGKIFVMSLTCAATYALMVYTEPYATTVNNVWLPLGIAMIISYVVVNLFMAVFARTLDTLLICFVAEEDMIARHGSSYNPKQPGMSKAIKQEVDDSKLEPPKNTPMHLDSKKGSNRFI